MPDDDTIMVKMILSQDELNRFRALGGDPVKHLERAINQLDKGFPAYTPLVEPTTLTLRIPKALHERAMRLYINAPPLETALSQYLARRKLA